MTEKTGNIKKDITQKTNIDIFPLVDKKIDFFKDFIQKTAINVQRNKFLDILGISDVNACIERLFELSKKISEITDNNNVSNHENTINRLQQINNDLSSIVKIYGTETLEDLLLICFGTNTKITSHEREQQKFELLKKYFHPVSYKVVNKTDAKQKKQDESVDETVNLTCKEVISVYKQFHMKVYGIKLYVYSSTLKKGLIIFGFMDDVVVDFLNNPYIIEKQNRIRENLPQEEEFQKDTFDKFMSSLTLKDFLVFETEHEIYSKFLGYISQNKRLTTKTSFPSGEGVYYG